MRKALKLTGIVIGVIILLIIIAAVVASQVINPNDYRDDIEAVVAQNTDRTLTIKGDIQLSLFPWIGVTVGKTTLSNAPGFPSRPFATINKMQLHVRVLSLLTGQTEVGTVALNGLRLNLARNAKGQTNWSDLLAGKSGQQGRAEKQPPSHILRKLTVDAIHVRNATINWRDAQTGTHYRVRNANITIGKLKAGQPFPVKLEFSFDRNKPVLHADVDIAATATINPQSQHYRLANGSVKIVARGAGLPAQPTHVGASWNDIRLNLQSDTFELEKLVLDTLGVKALANLEGQGVGHKLTVNGTLTVPDFSPANVLAKMGHHLQSSDPMVLQHASLSAHIAATDHSAVLSHLKMRLDDTHVTGKLAIPNFKTHALNFDFAMDGINADRYLPTPVKKVAKHKTPGSLDNIPLPGRLLHGLNLHGSLTIGQLTAFGLTANDVSLVLDAADGVLHVKPLSASLYGGVYKGIVTAKAMGNGLKIDASQHLSNIHFGPLLQDFYGEKILSGTTSVNVNFEGHGDTVGALVKTLDGKVDFAVKHGAIMGIDVWGALRRAYAILKNKPVPKQTGPDRTEFVGLNGSGVIKNGVIHNKNFSLRLPFMRIKGAGTINLVNNYIAYDWQAKVIKTPSVDASSNLGKLLVGRTVPIHVEGHFDDFKAFPSLRDVLKQRVHKKVEQKKAEVDKKLDKKKEDIKDKLDQKLNDKLQGLFH